MTFKKVIISFLILIQCFSPVVALAGPVPAEAKTVKVGYFADSGMMNGAEEGAQKSGYCYDYIQEIASNAGWKFEYVYGGFGELYEMLKNGEIDMLPYVTKTEQRTKEVLFPDTSMGDEQWFLASKKKGRLSDDLHELQGKRIGAQKGAYYLKSFNEMLKAKGIDCEIIEFVETQNRWLSLDNGDIAYSVESSTVYQDIDVHAVYEIGERQPFYLAVSGAREDLLNELNYAINSIMAVYPGFLSDLNLTYFKGIPLFKELTDEGDRWASRHDCIVIGTYDRDEPYVIENADGTFSGIAVDQMELMMSSLGIDLPIKWRLYPGRDEAIEALKAGHVDCINPYYHNYSDAENDGLVISQTVYNSNFSVLYMGQYTEETLSAIATPITRLGGNYVRDNYPGATIVPCQNGYDCLEKLKSGEATCVMMYTDALQEIAETFSKRHSMKNLEAECSVCYAALPEDAALIGIINKAIPFITNEERSRIQNKYSVERKTESLGQFLRTHPEYVYGSAALLMIIGLVIVLIWRKRANDEIVSLTENLTLSYNILYRVNLKKDTFTILRMDDDMQGYGKAFSTFTQVKEFFYANVVHKSDLDFVCRELNYNTIRENLRTKKTYSVEFRVMIHGETLWNELNITAIDANDVAIGFAERDIEIMKRRLENQRYDEYIALYVADLDTEMIRTIKASRAYEAGVVTTVVPYESAMEDFAHSLPDDARKFFLQMAEIRHVRETFANEDKLTYSYKSFFGGSERWIEVTCFVILRHESGSAAMFTLGFSYVDSLSTDRNELQRQLRVASELREKQQTALINGFSKEYDGVCIQNLSDGIVRFLKTALGDEHVVEGETISFEEFNEILSAIINSSDIKLVRSYIADPAALRFKVQIGNSVSCEYRVNIGGDFNWWRATINRISEDEVLIGFKDCDSEIKDRIIKKHLLGEFDSIFFVDLDKNEVRSAKRSESTAVGDFDGKKVYSVTAMKFAEIVAAEYKNQWTSFSDPEYMKKYMAVEDHREFVYIIPGLERSMRRMTIDVIRRDDFEAKELLLAFIGIDNERANAMLLQKTIAEQVEELQEKDAQLRTALANAEIANSAKTSFLFNMSHDIRTPMNAIIGFTNIAKKNLDNRERLVDSLDKTQQASNLLLSLINSILDVSRVESGKAVVEEVPGDIRCAFGNIKTTMQELARSKDINLTFEFGEIQDPYVFGDYDRCTRIFINIITNAIKYTGEGGYVRVFCEQAGRNGDRGLYRFTIEDNGIGMSEKFQSELFEPFSREENELTKSVQGTGLGLAVVKSFVDLLSGTIECESELGKGTKFIVTLPMRIQENPDTMSKTDPVTGLMAEGENSGVHDEWSLEVSLEGKRALLVDDNALNRDIATDILEEVSVIVETAEDGYDALHVMEEKGPDFFDFILMDINMPGMNGYETAGKIRDMYPDVHIPIIALSANAFAEDKAASIAAGMDDHVAKPIKVKELIGVLGKWLRRTGVRTGVRTGDSPRV